MRSMAISLESRDSFLRYVSAVVRSNERRCQIQYDEQRVASDGALLNFLAVLQPFASKVKLGKINAAYPHQPQSMVVALQHAKIGMDANKYSTYRESLAGGTTTATKEGAVADLKTQSMAAIRREASGPSSNVDASQDEVVASSGGDGSAVYLPPLLACAGPSFSEINFSTHMWFLAIHAHHVALIPSIRLVMAVNHAPEK